MRLPAIGNLLLVNHRRMEVESIPTTASGTLRVVGIDCSKHLEGKCIQLCRQVSGHTMQSTFVLRGSAANGIDDNVAEEN